VHALTSFTLGQHMALRASKEARPSHSTNSARAIRALRRHNAKLARQQGSQAMVCTQVVVDSGETCGRVRKVCAPRLAHLCETAERVLGAELLGTLWKLLE